MAEGRVFYAHTHTHTQTQSSLLAQCPVCGVPLDIIIHQFKGTFCPNSPDQNQVDKHKSPLLLHSSGRETSKWDRGLGPTGPLVSQS